MSNVTYDDANTNVQQLSYESVLDSLEASLIFFCQGFLGGFVIDIFFSRQHILATLYGLQTDKAGHLQDEDIIKTQ